MSLIFINVTYILLKRIVCTTKVRFCHPLLTLMMIQSCMMIFFSQKNKRIQVTVVRMIFRGGKKAWSTNSQMFCFINKNVTWYQKLENMTILSSKLCFPDLTQILCTLELWGSYHFWVLLQFKLDITNSMNKLEAHWMIDTLSCSLRIEQCYMRMNHSVGFVNSINMFIEIIIFYHFDESGHPNVSCYEFITLCHYTFPYENVL